MNNIETPINPWELSEKDIQKLKDGRVVLSLSGGKDSTACALLLEKHGIKFESVFMDTGWEHPVLYEYIKDVLEPRFGSITVLTSEKYPGGMVDLIKHKGVFPSRKMRFCTSYLKVLPFQKYIEELDDAIISVVGIRRQESQNRSTAQRWSYDEELDIDVFRPLVDHTFDDVIEMHRSSGIPPNPLYLRGASRVGCFPCIYSRKSEIENVEKLYPERINQIDQMEKELTEASMLRYEEDEAYRDRYLGRISRRLAFDRALKPAGIKWGDFKNFLSEKFELPNQLVAAYEAELASVLEKKENDPEFIKEKNRALARTFFHGRTDEGIKSVLKWSKTTRGGIQYKLFDLSARDGCTRWGMCEAALDESELVKITQRRKNKNGH